MLTLSSMENLIVECNLLGSRQDTQAELPMGLITPCMLKNSQAAHLNFDISLYIVYPLLAAGPHYIAISEPYSLSPTQWEYWLTNPTTSPFLILYARNIPRLRTWTSDTSPTSPLFSTVPNYIAILLAIKAQLNCFFLNICFVRNN